MKNNSHDLKDVAFLIYCRIDSEDRQRNLGLVIGHIQKYFDTNIMLWEMDTVPKIPQRIKRLAGLSYLFIKDDDPILHTTKYRNAMVRQCDVPYFFVCDTDVIAAPEALIKCTEHLRTTSERTIVFPFNGDCLDVPKIIKDQYVKNQQYSFLKNEQSHFRLWFKYVVGGIYGGRIMDFRESGPDNENIYGWGPDDKERYYRLKREGFVIVRADTPLYHLYHDRKTNSWHVNRETRTKNEQEYMKLFQNG